jgi:hypothetical protein
MCGMGSEPFFDLKFPKWDPTADLGAATSSGPYAATVAVVTMLELVAVAVLLLAMGAALVWLVRSWRRSTAFRFERARAPVLEGADQALERAHAQYRFIWRALDEKRFGANLRELLRGADELVAAQEPVLQHAAKRLAPGALERMRRSVSQVREALAQKATRYGEQAWHEALPLPEALERLRTVDPRQLSRGLTLRALVVASVGVVCVDATGSTVTPLLANPLALVFFFGPVLVVGAGFVASALLQGMTRATSTLLSFTALAGLAGLSAAVAWPVSLVPTVALGLWWACSRLLVHLSPREVRAAGGST